MVDNNIKEKWVIIGLICMAYLFAVGVVGYTSHTDKIKYMYEGGKVVHEAWNPDK